MSQASVFVCRFCNKDLTDLFVIVHDQVSSYLKCVRIQKPTNLYFVKKVDNSVVTLTREELVAIGMID